jgi:hypothetical protein
MTPCGPSRITLFPLPPGMIREHGNNAVWARVVPASTSGHCSRFPMWEHAALGAGCSRVPASLRPEAGTARERGSRRLQPC